MPHPLTYCLVCSVKCCGKLATATALLLWQKYLESCDKKLTIQRKRIYVCTVLLQFLVLYVGHCFSATKGHAQVSCTYIIMYPNT